MTLITRVADPKDILNKDKFTYKYPDGRPVTDKPTLEWIMSLRIPPAWTETKIWYGISQSQTCCGRDDKGRLQCLYSAVHKDRAKKQKYCALIKFGEMLPRIQSDLRAALESDRWTRNKVVALILRLVMCCGMRLGTRVYESQNDSYGLTTVLKDHITFTHTGAEIHFVGKKGVVNHCEVCDVQLVSLLRDLVKAQSKDPHVMMYTLGGEWVHISHLDVNTWLAERGDDFTSKNFRTWQANITLIETLQDDPTSLSITARKKNINEAADKVAFTIHNTRAVSKSQYCDPEIIDMYIDHPVRYRKMFITPGTPARNMFINFLKMKCVIPN